VDSALLAHGRFDFDLDVGATPPLARLRAWVASVLEGICPDQLLDAEMVCTELATNAHEHASGPRRVRLLTMPRRGVVRVEVDDASPDAVPVVGASRLGPHRGRGLLMVNTMAPRWGVRRYRFGKTTWAEVPAALPVG
jgi:hypothetical protein